MEFLDKKEATKEEIEKNHTGRHLLEYGNIITKKHLAGLEEWKRNGLLLQEVVALINALGPIKPWNLDDQGYTNFYFMPLCHNKIKEMYDSDSRFGIFVQKLQQRGRFTMNPDDSDWLELGTFVQEVVYDARTELERVGVVNKEGRINPKATVQPPENVKRAELRRI